MLTQSLAKYFFLYDGFNNKPMNQLKVFSDNI